MDLKDIGRGLWYLIHRASLDITTSSEEDVRISYDRFGEILNYVIKYLPCPVCRSHASELLNAYPPPTLDEISYLWKENVNLRHFVEGTSYPATPQRSVNPSQNIMVSIEDFPIFVWSWNYHNIVNTKLNKMTPSLQSVFSLYVTYLHVN